MFNKVCTRCGYKSLKYFSDCPNCGAHMNYHNHCWNCHQSLDSDSEERCPECGWFICSKCGACRSKPKCEMGKERISNFEEGDHFDEDYY